MNNHANTGNVKEHQHSLFAFFRFFFAAGVILLIMFAVPFLLGICIGHFWGFLAGFVFTVVYVWLGVRQTMAFSTRVIWIIGIAFLLFAMCFEFTQMSR